MALKEVCIATRAVGRNTQAGDIVCVRDPLGVIGMREGRDFVWLLLDESELPVMTIDSDRYQLPLDELKRLVPSLSLERLANPGDWYQPFLDCCPKTGRARKATTVSVGRAVRAKHDKR